MHAAKNIVVECRKSFADKVSRIMFGSDLSLTGLATKTKTSRSQLQRVIKGKVTLDALVTMSDKLGYEVKIDVIPKHRMA